MKSWSSAPSIARKPNPHRVQSVTEWTHGLGSRLPKMPTGEKDARLGGLDHGRGNGRRGLAGDTSGAGARARPGRWRRLRPPRPRRCGALRGDRAVGPRLVARGPPCRSEFRRRGRLLAVRHRLARQRVPPASRGGRRAAWALRRGAAARIDAARGGRAGVRRARTGLGPRAPARRLGGPGHRGARRARGRGNAARRPPPPRCFRRGDGGRRDAGPDRGRGRRPGGTSRPLAGHRRLRGRPDARARRRHAAHARQRPRRSRRCGRALGRGRHLRRRASGRDPLPCRRDGGRRDLRPGRARGLGPAAH